MKGSAALLAVLLLIHPAGAEPRSPASLLGGILIVLAVVEHCRIVLPADKESALLAAGEGLQARLRLSNAEVLALADESMTDARRADCTIARDAVPATAEDLLRQVAALPAPGGGP